MMFAAESPKGVRTFDVICAGEALVAFDDAREPNRFCARGGAVSAALSLARQGMRVGLATVLEDDLVGRSMRENLAGAGIDADGVQLAHSKSGMVLVRGGARQRVLQQEQEEPVSVPAHWASKVLLLSGMSPVVAHGAALCRAARAARRAGSVVVVDVNVRWERWVGRDARAVRMILREADVVWASAEDLFGLDMNAHEMRDAMRPTAILASSDPKGAPFVWGPFGELSAAGPPGSEAEPFPTVICAELATRASGAERNGDIWLRALATR